MIAILNAVLVDGGKGDIVAIGLVENEHEGELWFGENKPNDGTQVDYVLHNISEVFAAPDLLDACKESLIIFREVLSQHMEHDASGRRRKLPIERMLEAAITKAEP